MARPISMTDRPAMTGTLGHLLLAATAFVCGHFLLASPPLRPLLVGRIGENGFRGLFSVMAIATLAWLILTYADAPARELWPFAEWARYVPIVVMPLALLLLVGGLSAPNPTALGQDARLSERVAPAGVLKITRHPAMWAIALWALAHIPANGDLASLVFFASIAALALVGMAKIDRKTEARVGAAWGPFALATSIVPFAALIGGRGRLAFKEIGWWRVIAALALYAVLLHTHGWITGLPALPG